MIPLNYHHLYYFYMVASAGGISEACKKLLLAQSTVSMQLKQLEKSLNCKLFKRKKQRLSLTEEGRMVFTHASGMFEAGEELLRALQGKGQTPNPSIKIGVLGGTPPAFTHAFLECILRRQAETRLIVREVDPASLTAGLRQQEFDMALSRSIVRGEDRGEFVTHLVGRVPMVMAVAPRLEHKYRRIPADLDGAPFIVPTAPSEVLDRIMDAWDRWKIRPRVVAEVNDIELVRRLALGGKGIAVLNAFTLEATRPVGALKRLGSRIDFDAYESIYLMARKTRKPNTIFEWLVNNFRLPSKESVASERDTGAFSRANVR